MKFILFIRSECPYCIKAEQLLESKNIPYNTVSFDDSNQKALNEIKEAYDWSTVPIIFKKVGDVMTFVGGYTDLAENLKND